MEKKNLTIRVSDDEREWLEKEAKAQCRSTGNFIRYILSLYRENQNGISPLSSDKSREDGDATVAISKSCSPSQ